jgi:hypothetical protein
MEPGCVFPDDSLTLPSGLATNWQPALPVCYSDGYDLFSDKQNLMDTIKVDELKRDFPKTWEAINTEKNRSHVIFKQVYIRRFLENNGYSISCRPSTYSSKVTPQIVYHGNEVGKDDFFRVDGFDPMTRPKAKKTGLMFALRHFEKSCYGANLLGWD